MRILEKYFKLLLLMGLLSSFAHAQQGSSPPPCEADAQFAEFDFWLGTWDVHDAQGNFAGTNTIIREQSGCVLMENWSGVQGGTGMSINYLDKAKGEWVQIWHAASGYQIDIRGGLTKDGMLLTGTIHYINNGNTAAFRGLWTPLPDGRVRQFFRTVQ